MNKPTSARLVKMKSLKELVRGGMIEIIGGSDDGEFIRFKILPDGPEIGQWYAFEKLLQVVDRDTVHANMVKAFPQLFESELNTEPGEGSK